jgi:hypothetical protein
MSAITESDLLQKAKSILESEGVELEGESLTDSQLLKDFILPGLKSSKEVLSSIYAFKPRKRGDFIGKFKSKIQEKIVNTVVNVMEKQSMKQQKFNELVYQAIEKLITENETLREQLKNR